ncbi:FAD-dependent thymidylate synthase [Rhizobium sp. FKL33]|uniref:FAD-dependent thymidylate synthase n=1 Tax=Rhizobium sp. FKL33 TaxID=2562307 RepID=UPI0010C118CC|nr:FAD-dependent thymidylate synthase [Rhizobium sp. FKL33]
MAGLTSEQTAEIEYLRSTHSSTLRPVSPGLEEILHKSFSVLDHGIIRVVDYMGDDSAIVQAARVSYGRGTKRIQEDSGLIRYLLRHHHTTPFEMAEIKFHVKLPIFVARQWIRHRTASVNEYSARYSVLDKEFYIPQPEHLAAQSTSNRQGRGAVLEGDEAAEVLSLLRRDAEQAYDDYSTMLNEPAGPDHREDRSGLARELARMNLSLNFYTQWYWKTDLHNLMNFLRLRADSHAQYEIRAYAEIMLEIMAAWVPIAHSAFKEYRMEAVQLSGTAVKAVRRMIAGEAVSQENSGLSAREWQELNAALALTSLKAP